MTILSRVMVPTIPLISSRKFAKLAAMSFLHPAFEWFQWDDETAADQYRIWQARTFVQGLRIKFEVITTKRSISGVVVREAPAYVSPIEDRRAGGGYLQVDMDNADHVAELLRQASVSFETWVRRYGDVFITAGGKESDFAKIRKILTNIENHKMIAAE